VLSSIFDFVTFGVLLVGFAAAVDVFRTGWFMESLLTELVIALVVRTRRPFFRSRPGDVLLWSTVVLIAATLAVPFLPGAALFGFVPVPAGVLASIGFVTVLYVMAAEMLKHWFYRPTLRPSSVTRGSYATRSRVPPGRDPVR